MKKIGEDFQGWPVNALTLKEFLEELGLSVVKRDNSYRIRGTISCKKGDAYPILFKDDGMGYGAANPDFITDDISKDIYKSSELDELCFNIFVSPNYDKK
jgi:hypothetical protein